MLNRATNLAWIAFLVSLTAVGRAPSSQAFSGVLLSSFVFAAVLTWLPRCRPVVKTPLCPWNWALFVFALQLVGLPLLITLDKPSVGVLPSLPSAFAINLAMVMNCLAFLTVCLVYNHFSKFRTAPPVGVDVTRTAPEQERRGPGGWLVVSVVLGVAGIILSFGNLAGILDYFNDPFFFRAYMKDMSSTWRGVAALLSKPFLGFAVIMSWCRWMDLRRHNSSWLRRTLVTILMLAGVVVSLSLVSYNRGAILVPLISVAAVAMANGDPCSRRTIVTIGLLILILSPALAVYRSGTELGENLLARPDLTDMMMENVDVSDLVQMYGAAPQYLGFLLERSHWGQDPHWGGVTISSILSPLPVVGKFFRPHSGFALYNRLIYGTDAIADQNASFVGETFLDLSVVGVVFGYAVFGWIIFRVQRAFERARSSLELYIWQFLSVWLCFVIIGSIDVTSQILIYSCWPIYLFWITDRVRRRRSLAAPATTHRPDVTRSSQPSILVPDTGN